MLIFFKRSKIFCLPNFVLGLGWRSTSLNIKDYSGCGPLGLKQDFPPSFRGPECFEHGDLIGWIFFFFFVLRNLKEK